MNSTARSAAVATLKANDPCWCGSGRKYKRCHKGLEGKVLPGRVTPMRKPPPDIPGPDYALTGQPGGESSSDTVASMVKSPDVIERMRRAGRVAAEVLAETGAAVKIGVTTEELDDVCYHAYVSRGAYPSTLNYHGYPKSCCTSVNEVICHGIPDDRPLQDGDILNIDVTAYIDGVHGDCSAMFLVGNVDSESRRLVEVTRECRDLGIAAVKPGRPISDIGRAIEKHAHANKFGVVRHFIGHGIGEQFHTAPSIPHYYEPRATTEMVPGMTFTIEPMITVGTWREKMWDNGWTAVTADGKRSAQYEHMLVVTEDAAEVLTAL